MLIDERKKRILRAIIDNYVDTAEPVGSRTIARRNELGLSSATIRNEMADLEDMGYLEQPHTSAGRIPSDKGYRLYVDSLMELRQLNVEEINVIKKALDVKINELGQLIKQASVILSKITKYTSMAITPQMKKCTLKAVQVVPIESGKVLIVVVSSAGIAKNVVIKIGSNLSPEFIINVSNIINEMLSGLTIEQINLPIIREIENRLGLSKEIVLPILNGVADCINQIDHSEIYLDGATNIFNYPEFKDIIKAKGFLDILDEKEILASMLKDSALLEEKMKINIQIGTENKVPEIQDCALITASYHIGDTLIGSMGVIGPTRMEYARVIATINYIKNIMDKEILKLFEGNFNET